MKTSIHSIRMRTDHRLTVSRRGVGSARLNADPSPYKNHSMMQTPLQADAPPSKGRHPREQNDTRL